MKYHCCNPHQRNVDRQHHYQFSIQSKVAHREVLYHYALHGRLHSLYSKFQLLLWLIRSEHLYLNNLQCLCSWVNWLELLQIIQYHWLTCSRRKSLEECCRCSWLAQLFHWNASSRRGYGSPFQACRCPCRSSWKILFTCFLILWVGHDWVRLWMLEWFCFTFFFVFFRFIFIFRLVI